MVTETNPAGGDRFKFAGMQFDSIALNYFDHARLFNAGIGRFNTRDPMGFNAGDPNLYRYTGNNAPDRTDPSGLDDSPSSLLGDYFHYLVNPGSMDGDLQTGFYSALAVAGAAATLAAGLAAVSMLGLGAGGAEAVSAVMAEEGLAAVAAGETAVAGTTAIGEGAMVATAEATSAASAEALAAVAETATASESAMIASAESATAIAEGEAALTSNQIGRIGETFANTLGPKIRIVINGRLRIPDAIDWPAKMVHEVKNVARQSFTRQLKDMLDFSQANGLRFTLWLRDGAKISAQLRTAIDQGLIILETIPPPTIPLG